ncbi:MAG: carboxypeptidase regulatory-like domain-containing protein, partial [Candidatus Hydrogenedentes bacterium]|nr:carboxypeptidase regulatory-like domain-containing protein [Candidatus Hydrogenedentota bacterium]
MARVRKWMISGLLAGLMALAAIVVFPLLDPDLGDFADSQVEPLVPLPVSSFPGDPSPAATVVLPAGASITGKVVAASTGAPIHGAVITLVQSELTIGQAATGADGTFNYSGVAPGDYEVVALPRLGAREVAGSRQQVHLADGDSRDLTFTLDDTALITGRVLDADGVAIAGVQVQGIQDDEPYRSASDHTDDTGAYALAGFQIGDRVHLRLGAPWQSAAPVTEGLVLSAEGLVVDIHLAPLGAVEGVVVDTAGRPLGRVEVSATQEESVQDGPVVRTDPQGLFRIDRLAAGRYALQAGYPTGPSPYSSGSIRMITDADPPTVSVAVRPQEVVSHIRLTVSEDPPVTLAIAGLVEDDTGQPIPGAKVEAVNGRNLATATTDPEGHYHLAWLPERPLNITVTAQGYGPAFRQGCLPGAGDADFVLLPCGSLAVSVRDEATSQPVERFEIWERQGEPPALHEYAPEYGVSTVSADKGEYRIENLAPGLHQVFVRAAGYATAVMPVEIISRQTAMLEIGLAPARPREGVVMAPDGSLVADAGIRFGLPPAQAIGLETSGIVTRTNAQGHFRLDDVPDDAQAICAIHPEYLPGTASLQSEGPLLIRLGAPASVEGLVTWQGAPVADARVWLRVDQGIVPLDEIVTTADGHYAFPRVTPGQAHLSVSLKHGEQHVSEETAFDLLDGETRRVDFDLGLAGAGLEGKLVNLPRDVSPQGFLVFVETGEGGRASVQPDASGSFLLEGLPAGPASIEVRYGAGGLGGLSQSAEMDLEEGHRSRHDFDFGAVTAVEGQFRGIRAGEMGVVIALPP